MFNYLRKIQQWRLKIHCINRSNSLIQLSLQISLYLFSINRLSSFLETAKQILYHLINFKTTQKTNGRILMVQSAKIWVKVKIMHTLILLAIFQTIRSSLLFHKLQKSQIRVRNRRNQVILARKSYKQSLNRDLRCNRHLINNYIIPKFISTIQRLLNRYQMH